jgi:hypothetical protein
MPKTKKKKKSQKPIEIDLHLKYRCPNPKCGFFHWLSLLETKTQGFKMVCTCGTVFSPKKIQKVSIKYATVKKKKEIPQPTHQTEDKSKKQEINQELLDKCTNVLSIYGFTNKEVEPVIIQAYKNSPTEDCITLVKATLKLLGDCT